MTEEDYRESSGEKLPNIIETPLIRTIKWGSGMAIAGIFIYAPFGLYSAAQQGKINEEHQNQEQAVRILEEFDDNSDGVLDKNELLNYIRNIYTGKNPNKNK